MLNFIKRLIPPEFKNILKNALGIKTMGNRLKSLANAGFSCTGAIDVGAYHGEWSKELRSSWLVPLILVEPQDDCKSVLERYIADSKELPTRLENCAVGKTSGVANFLLQETNSRIELEPHQVDVPFHQVQVKTLKEILAADAEKYNLLKVDVQGFELEVLEGAGDLLSQFEVIILEVSIIRIGPVPTFYEVMQYMDGKGYRLYDFLPMYYRPKDNALWQGDAFFVRNDSPLVASLSWD